MTLILRNMKFLNTWGWHFLLCERKTGSYGPLRFFVGTCWISMTLMFPCSTPRNSLWIISSHITQSLTLKGLIMFSQAEQKEHRAALVAALRSGEYKQERFGLRTTNDNFCCLGVACDVYRKATGDGEWTVNSFGLHRYNRVQVIPLSIILCVR